MANDDTDSLLGQDWPTIRSRPLIVGGVLIGVGAVVAMVGAAIAGSHVFAATRSWVKDLETPPAELARLKWEQARTAMSSGAATWRQHPNAKVGLARRASSAGD